MTVRLKSRVQEFCDRSHHRYELTIDGYLMAKGKDGKWRSEFDEGTLPEDEDVNIFFLKEEE